MIKFILLKDSYCIECRKNILHEYGRNLETGQDVKKCIHCDTLTEVKSEKQQAVNKKP
jgi:hypothetical protein